MTVQELIDKLKTLPPELLVWHDGGGDPYCAGEIHTVEILSTKGWGLLGHKEIPDRMVWLSL